ncbi:MAG: hypothetical protein QM770_24020 [Tepidisphaeraceae bacterium]
MNPNLPDHGHADRRVTTERVAWVVGTFICGALALRLVNSVALRPKTKTSSRRWPTCIG